MLSFVCRRAETTIFWDWGYSLRIRSPRSTATATGFAVGVSRCSEFILHKLVFRTKSSEVSLQKSVGVFAGVD